MALCCDNKVLFYEFRAVTTENGRHEYIDLLEVPFHVELSFQPLHLQFCEGVISCWDGSVLNIFKVHRVGESQSISVSVDSLSSELAPIGDKPTNINAMNGSWSKEPIDFHQVAEKKMLNQTVFRVDMMSDSDDFGQCDLKPESVNHMLIMLRANGGSDSELMNKYTIKSLLQLKSRRRRSFCDSFKSVSIRPLYKSQQLAENAAISGGGKSERPSENIFQSIHSTALASISVAVATQQDAYLYHFHDEWHNQSGSGDGALVASYSFTSPVIDLAIDSVVLHALTETGIETYTLRTGQRIFYENQTGDEEILRPLNVEEPICLIGIRPILATRRIFCSGTNVLVLISNERESCTDNEEMDDGQWMVCSLRKPEMETLYQNIEEFATRFRLDNPRLFVHLINEAHVMVRMAVEMSQTIPVDELNRQNLKSIPLITFNTNPDTKLQRIFTESCNTLADYFVMQVDRYNTVFRILNILYFLIGNYPRTIITWRCPIILWEVWASMRSSTV